MNKLVCSLSLLLLIVAGSCGSHDTGHVSPSPAPAAAAPAPKAPAPLTHDLALNGAEKWRMDDHTRQVFATMAGRFEGQSDSADVAALKETGAALNDDIAELIKGCTMEGAAHDELHKFLMLYLPAVGRMADTGSAESGGRVRELLGLYPDYFE